jgi:carbonic anhydrase/acetyltransferase-like protein (isoleucine patch superfamily)
MIIEHRGFKPVIHESVYVAPFAVIAGKVRIHTNVRVMYGAVLDSEASHVRIGEYTVVCEHAVIRATAAGDKEYPVIVGDHVFISPHTTLLGCTVQPCSYIATGATVLQGATIGSGAAIAVGAFVHAMTTIPDGFFVPPNTIAIGTPVRIYAPDEKKAIADAIRSVGFSRIAFNVDAAWEDRASRYKQSTESRSKEFGHHLNDTIVEGHE